ncbi:MAG: hypothetical protein K6B44_04650, partial [Lachnospiraceae bacterium]|nr:hypothetical protein [Lachnospiraceae bacterium]
MYHVFAEDAAYMDAEEFVENTMTAKENSKRDGVLDLMKIVATLCIVLHHYQQLTGAKWQGFNFWEDEHFYFGYLVELFFLISGIVSYADIEKIRKGKTLGSYW